MLLNYKRETLKKCIRKIVRFLLIWPLIWSASTAHSAPGDINAPPNICDVLITPSLIGIRYSAFTVGDSIQLYRLNPTSAAPLPRYFVNNGVLYNYISFETIAPTSNSITPITDTLTGEPTLTIDESTIIYLSAGADTQNRVCTVMYTLSFDGTNYNRSDFEVYNRLTPADNDPTAVPIFTPIGLITIICGLLWFGRRYSIKLTKS